MAEVEIRNVKKAYGNVEVIHGIDLTIRGGELTVLLGPSGCGKSTLLRMIAGLEDITSGSISIEGEVINNVSPSRRGCAMVFQNYALYPHKTVFKNIAFPLQMAGADRETIERRVQEVSEMLQIESLLSRLPRDLSGGQRQRVAMGRAMIREPKVFLFDEPLSNLDAELRVRMRMEISRLQESLHATMIFVTHDQVEAMTLADRIVVMRGGHIEQAGAPLDVYRRPANRFVASFLGSPSMNFLPVEIIPALSDSQHVAPKTAAEVGVRPEHIGLVRTADRSIPISLQQPSVLGTEHLGDRSYLHLQTGNGEITLLQEEDLAEGNTVPSTLYVDPDQVHFFEQDGRALPLRASS